MTEQPPPPGPGYGAAPQAGTRPGELLDRFLARLIDGILLAVVNGIIVTAIIVGAVMGQSANGFGVASSVLAGIVSAIITTAIYMGYFVYLESSRGQTIGKMVMKLKTVGPTGGNPTIEEAARRNIFMAFGLAGIIPIIGGAIGGIATLVGVIMIAVGINKDTVNRQAWHDEFAGGTRVVKLG